MSLNQLREKVNSLDEKIICLLNQRTKIALSIGKAKMTESKPVYSPEREMDVYRRIEKINKGPLPKQALKSIYREVMSSALGLQKKLVVSYLGPAATFTHEAARSKFGEAVNYFGASNISEIFNSVEKGYADYGVVPIENSIEGIVTHTQDMFIDANLRICAEIMLEISHNLLTKESDINKIKKIYSKAEVFGQCRTWIKTTLPAVELIDVASTANAAQKASKERHSAAIASRLAANLYGLNTLAKDIEDTPHNVTKFLVISNNYAGITGNDKTSIMFSIKDKVGALYDTLKAFKKNKINLTKIESRPSKRKAWEYYFFVDFLGHCDDKNIRNALKELEKHCVFVKILGSYPRVA
jgi:chorismate mutase/prephenate dehydratase